MEKKIYHIKFAAQAGFNSVVELSDNQLEKFKKAIGKNGFIGGNEIKFEGWSKFLQDHLEFDYFDRTQTDIEDIEITELDQCLRPVKEKKSKKNKKSMGIS
jgi:hypothetical protein